MANEHSPWAQAKDGTAFYKESPEVEAELAKFPDLTLEVALGNVVEAYNREHPVTPAE